MNLKTVSDSTEKRTVEIIPPVTQNASSASPTPAQGILRVAAYCRVSTDEESQQQSYDTQKRFYADYIHSRPGWCMAGIYADEAKSGTNTKYRPQFKQMMADAKKGKFDYIITKSISRLARNTIDALTAIRTLKSLTPPVGIFFERENLDSLDSKGELMLTILSALAQEESRSISENIRWAIQKNFEKGKAMVDPNRMMGYTKGPDPHGEWIINEPQAAIVRHIFKQFSQGISGNAIARELNNMGVTTVNGKKWYASAIFLILRNEKYVGDCEMQKYITESFLTHKSVKNTGHAKKFYVTNHHPAIIDRFLWDKVQFMLQKSSNAKNGSKTSTVPSLFKNLVCGNCGTNYFRTAYTSYAKNYTDERWTAADQYRETYTFSYNVWRCKGKYKKTKGKRRGRLSLEEKAGLDKNCPSKCLYECALKQSFMEMLYQLKQEYSVYGKSCKFYQKFEKAFQTVSHYEQTGSFTIERLKQLNLEISELENEYHKTLSHREHVLHLDDAPSKSQVSVYDALIRDLKQHLKQKKAEYTQLNEEILFSGHMKKTFSLFLHFLQELPTQNKAGMPLQIHGLNHIVSLTTNGNLTPSPETLQEAPDFLSFDKHLYHSFIKSGVVKGDLILYQTTFGIELESVGNHRTFSDFYGFRTCTDDGKVTLLTDAWQVNGKSVQYKKTLLHSSKDTAK
ncbi:MAG: recombinase family protein [Lachnospiraceae bacterium]|nr:recombinase family protein [Lachnospiraceae bacterium]